jgi:epoxyqueuosine reductase QueG
MEELEKYVAKEIREVFKGKKIYGISIGYKLADWVLDTIEGKPSLIYKHHYKVVNWLLDQVGEKVVNFIQLHGYKGITIPASQIVDWDRNVGHFPHSICAYYSGLGWIGRSGLVVHPKYGARVRYITIFTDMPLPPGNPLEIGCKDCMECITNCPVKAITKEGWDKDKCIEGLKGFAKIRGMGVYICGVCVKVCKGDGV